MPLDPHPPSRVRSLGRRSFLKASTLGAAALSLGMGSRPTAAALRTSRSPTAPGKARNVIFMVSDGMSFGTLTLADIYRRQHHGRQSNWLSLFSNPMVKRGLYATWSADSPVTDSSASGSAWGCGQHINNSAVNITPDGRQHLPILVQARQSGKATGLVTTTRITHATPASFLTNCARRDWEAQIAQQLLDRRADVALGGGAQFVTQGLIKDHADLSVVRNAADLIAVPEKAPPDRPRLLGLFSGAHIPFQLDRPDTVPSLAAMTRTALRRLDTHPNGFVLQIEGGRTDHAAHSNDAASIIAEQLAFDDAIAEVLAFADNGRRDDTLVVLTSDHGNANPGLTLYGAAAKEGLNRVARVKHSFEWITDRLAKIDKASIPDSLGPLVEEATDVKLEQSDLDILTGSLNGKRVAPFRELAHFTSALGGVLANSFGISFVSGNHTADYVEVTAFGPGADSITPTGHNVDLHEVMVASLALEPGRLLPGMEEPVKFPKAPKPD